MKQRRDWFLVGGPLLAVAMAAVSGVFAEETIKPFRAGTDLLDISPTNFPVIVNGMFTERSATNTTDPLYARSLVLDDGATRIALCVVDTCMMSRELIDRAKDIAHRGARIPTEH